MGLIIPVGKSRAGFIKEDLTKFPHLLVAGETGAGKSNYLHSVLITLAQYENVELYIIDLKRLEFEPYRDYAEIAFKTDGALKILYKLRKELDRRTETLAGLMCQNIKQYNERGGNMSYKVLVVDEFSQLYEKLVSEKEEKEKRKEAHQLLIDLVCLARAVGIHIILATQRPDAQILPGQLKANIPATVAFKVRNKTNSYIVLDNEKAAKLPSAKDVPGRAVYQFDVEREVQTLLVENPYSWLPEIPKTKPQIDDEATDISPY